MMRAPPGLVPRSRAGRRGRSRSKKLRGITLCPSGLGPLSAAPGRSDGRLLRQLDLYVHTCGQIELHQSVDRLRRRLNDVEQALVGAHLELLARLLVDVRRTVDGELLNARRKGNRTANKSTR